MTRIVATGNFPQWKGLTTHPGRPYLFGRNIARGYRSSKVRVDSDQMGEYWNETELDLMHLASSLLRFEELARKQEVPFNSHISFVVSDAKKWSSSDVKDELVDVLSLALPMMPRIDFSEGPPSKVEPNQSSIKESSVTLFSGGTDSLCGILASHSVLGSTVGLYVSHGQLSGKVADLKSESLEKKRIPLWTINVQRSGGALQQLRGFLYLVCGAVATRMVNCNALVVTESGQTMYQPQFVPNDEVTKTTHPMLINGVRSLVKLLLDREVRFVLPFEDMTKAEVLAGCDMPASIPGTHSCITSQFAYDAHAHCGRCYGCLVRRVSAIVAGVPDAHYAYDVFFQDVGERPRAIRGRKTRISSRDMENLTVLLRFAVDILEDRVPDFTAHKIEESQKHSLFRRFATDVLSAAYLVYVVKRKGHNKLVDGYLQDSFRRGVTSKEGLENRIAEVRSREWVPCFDVA